MASIFSGIGVGNKITTSYKGQQLNLILAEKGLSWDAYPVRISEAFWQTLNTERLLAIMQGKDLKPSLLAGLKPEQIVCITIQRIDMLYLRAIEDYKQRLEQASGEDLNQIKTLSKQYEGFSRKVSLEGAGIGSVLGTILGYSFGRSGKMIGGATGALTGSFFGFHLGKKLAQERIEWEGSAHRVKWMQTVDVLEDVRYKQIFDSIFNASMPLVEDLKSLEQQDQTDKHKVKQLQQLLLVHQAIFATTPLEVMLDLSAPNEKINVAQYIETLTQRFSALE